MEDFGRGWVNEDSPYLRGLVTPDLKLRNFNTAWEKILGYPHEMLLGKSLVRFIDQNEHAAALKLVNERLAAVEGKAIEFSLRCKDGSFRCFAWERQPAREEEGMLIAGQDITERKKMETTGNLQKYLQSRKAKGPA
jgi:PAS domain S-box-containing protein